MKTPFIFAVTMLLTLGVLWYNRRSGKEAV